MRLLVHGDDFLVLADEEGHTFVDRVLRERYEFKCDGRIGPGRQTKQSMSVLNRMVTYHPDSGDLRSRPATLWSNCPRVGSREGKTAKDARWKEETWRSNEITRTPTIEWWIATAIYRSLTMRAAFLSQDRPNLAEATRSLARHMKTRNESAYNDLKRLGRYLRGRQRLGCEYWPQRYQKGLIVFCDSDHAGCIISRRSTTGLVTMFGSHCIKHSSNIQKKPPLYPAKVSITLSCVLQRPDYQHRHYLTGDWKCPWQSSLTVRQHEEWHNVKV